MDGFGWLVVGPGVLIAHYARSEVDALALAEIEAKHHPGCAYRVARVEAVGRTVRGWGGPVRFSRPAAVCGAQRAA